MNSFLIPGRVFFSNESTSLGSTGSNCTAAATTLCIQEEKRACSNVGGGGGGEKRTCSNAGREAGMRHKECSFIKSGRTRTHAGGEIRRLFVKGHHEHYVDISALILFQEISRHACLTYMGKNQTRNKRFFLGNKHATEGKENRLFGHTVSSHSKAHGYNQYLRQRCECLNDA